MRFIVRVAAALACSLSAAAALAQEEPATAPAAAPCELHIWPAERMHSMSQGLLGGGLIDALIHAEGDASNRAQLASALDSQSQLDALQSLDLRSLLELPAGTVFVPHETPIERRTMNRVKTRRSDSAAACYYELFTADVFFQRSPIYGRSLRTLFMLRAFGDDQRIDFEYKAWGGNGISHFPPREGEDVTVAITELIDVFKRNFEEYANNERRAAARRRPRRR